MAKRTLYIETESRVFQIEITTTIHGSGTVEEQVDISQVSGKPAPPEFYQKWLKEMIEKITAQGTTSILLSRIIFEEEGK